MKKLLFLLVAFFSFNVVSLAAEVKIGFDEEMKSNQTIKYEKKDEISVAIFYESSDFDLLAMLADLEYDKEKLELIDYKEANGFTITIGEKILADRYGEDYPTEGKVVTLNFKVKKYDDVEIKLKDISVANMEEELELDSVTVKLVAENSNFVLYFVGGAFLIGAVIAGFMFYKNSNKNPRKKK